MFETVGPTEYCEEVEQYAFLSSFTSSTYRLTHRVRVSEGSPTELHLQRELQANRQLLEEKERLITSLKARIAKLQRRDEEQSTALASVRHDYSLCLSQLDSVQRFISTADTHADQDIIQKLRELNEEVYQISMEMADYVVERCVRQTRRTKGDNSVGGTLVATIGSVLVNQLAAVEGNEDTALLLQIAFQGYLSHLFHHIASSWTSDQRLNALIEGAHQRLRKAGELSDVRIQPNTR